VSRPEATDEASHSRNIDLTNWGSQDYSQSKVDVNKTSERGNLLARQRKGLKSVALANRRRRYVTSGRPNGISTHEWVAKQEQ